MRRIKIYNSNRIMVFTIAFMMIFSITVYADTGPKPSITILGTNMPDGICYMDLLVPDDNSNIHDNYDNLDSLDDYNSDILEMLMNHGIEGWHLGMVEGTYAPMNGDIYCVANDGQCNMEYSYVGVPDKFRIIVASESGEKVISNIVEKKAFQSTVSFDYESGKASEVSLFKDNFFQLIGTLLSTLIIEFLILVLFSFDIKRNILPFAVVNIITQILLTIVVAFATLLGGTFSAFVWYILFEVFIFIAEFILFRRFLSGHSLHRRGIYAIMANAISFVAGILYLI